LQFANRLALRCWFAPFVTLDLANVRRASTGRDSIPSRSFDRLADSRFSPTDASPDYSLRKPARTYWFQLVKSFSLFAGALQRFCRRTHEFRAPSPAH